MIAVDVGNTNVRFVRFEGKKTASVAVHPTHAITRADIVSVLAREPGPFVVCSVVPRVTRLFEGVRPRTYIVGKDIAVPIASRYDKRTIGMDRLVAAFAARTLHRNTRIVVDFGTAVTVDILSKHGTYQGGLILPGIGSTLRVLSSCALLPDHIVVHRVAARIPVTTRSSIAKGIEEGFSLMINGLIRKYRRMLAIPRTQPVIVTGGDAVTIKKRFDFAYRWEPLLVEKGLFALSRHYRLL